MARVGIIVEFSVEARNHAALTAIIEEHARLTRQEEPGCQQFDVFQPVQDGVPDASRLMIVEVYADDAAFAEHGRNPRLAKVREAYAPLIEGRKLTICRV